MNCQECRELLVAREEGVLEPHRRGELVEHLSACPECRAFGEVEGELHRRLQRRGDLFRRHTDPQAVMDRIVREQSFQLRRLTMQKRMRFASAGIAAAAVLVIAFGLSGLLHQKEASASDVLAAASMAASKLDSVHLKGRMRTIAHDNFEMIGLEYDFVPIEMWKQFTPTSKWRVDKSGRVAVMDGNELVMLIKSKPPEAAKAGPKSGLVGFLKSLLDVDKVLDRELAIAVKEGSDLQLTHQQGRDGAEELMVTINTKATVNPNDWLRNKYIEESDTRRIYTFDAKSKLLKGLQIFVKTKNADVLVLEISQVECNPKLAPDLFVLELPKDTVWFQEPQVLPDNKKYEAMTPEETARAFFEACEKEDWGEVQKFWCTTAIPEDLKRYLGGLKLINLGKAFKSPGYGGYFVPYEIKLKDGYTKKMNLAVRNDNPAHRYVVDGGI